MTAGFAPDCDGHSSFVIRPADRLEFPMTDITQLIQSDHREVEALFAKFKEDGTKQVALQICDELEAHASAEETVFYPVVHDDVPEGAELADEGNQEHSEARQLIGRIKNTGDDDHLAELVGELEQAINHHVSEEESEMLPKARESLSAERLDALGAEFEEAKGK
jgi:hemerythrin superfamily protein